MCGGREGEPGRGGGGGRGRENIPSSKRFDKHKRQNHSTSTAHQLINTTSKRVMTEVSIRKVYRIRMDSLDVVSVYYSSEITNLGEKIYFFIISYHIQWSNGALPKNDDDVFYLFLQKQKSAQSYIPQGYFPPYEIV
jgi:hypothetical protein